MNRVSMVVLVVAIALARGSFYVNAALADGMPAPVQEYRACANWSGAYVGPDFGAGFAHTDWKWLNDNYFDIGPGDHSSIDPRGFVFGVHGGLQGQWGCWVAGLEGTFSGGDITKRILSPFFPDSDHHTATISSVATATGRLGYSIKDFLLYGKAGLAAGKVELIAVGDVPDSFFVGDGASSRAWQSGWTVGAGIDYQVRHNILFGLDYNYINLGDATHHFAQNCATADCIGFDAPIVKTQVDMHIVTARVTFLFGGEGRVGPFK